MGRGRKKITLTLPEKPAPQWTQNCSISARNLSKSKLYGMIFGCSNATYKECILKQLFGLPAAHFSYVKNVTVNMPLFLFNYSDRKIHGVFEAASPGQMNIDNYAWTLDGSEKTAFPAQVRVKVRMQCEPLNEEKYQPILAENYHEYTHFWFELDKVQTQQLISLFSKSPAKQRASAPQSTARWGTFFATPSHRGFSEIPVDANSGCTTASNISRDSSSEVAPKKENENSEFTNHGGLEISESVTVPCSQKTWSSLFKPLSALPAKNDSGSSQLPDSSENTPNLTQSDIEWESWPIEAAFCSETQVLKSSTDYTIPDKWDEVDEMKLNSEFQESFELTEATTCPSEHWEEHSLCDDGQHVSEDSKIMSLKEDSSLASHTEFWSSSVDHDPEVMPLESHSDEDAKETHESRSDEDGLETQEEQLISLMKITPLEAHLHEEAMETQLGQPVTLMKIMQAIDEMRSYGLEQSQRIQSLEQDLAQCRTEMREMQSKFRAFETGSSLSTCHNKEEEAENFILQREASIFIVGGSNGSSWLSALDSYDPSRDLLSCLEPMGSVRCCPCVAKLNGELYVLGGRDPACSTWYNTVESYDQANDCWVSRPPMNKKKANLAGASAANKIFAIGGADGKECFSEVEMLDPSMGKWITTRSMFVKRMASASAEINGAIFAVGGFDGMRYLKTVERFDPREHSWTRVANLSTSRGCHSLAVLNGKLYAIGGFDGDTMTPTVEVLDPRIGTWMMGEPMNEPRGYMGAVTIGNSIYVIGGMQKSNHGSDIISNTVECYTDGRGWETMKLRSIGRRCFLSAVTA